MITALLDTHALIWLGNGDRRYGASARRFTDEVFAAEGLGVSVISFWEAALLHRRGRAVLPEPPLAWRERVLRNGIAEVPLDGATAILAEMIEQFHADPADRFIVATCISLGAILLTADDKILSWPGNLNRLDVRR